MSRPRQDCELHQRRLCHEVIFTRNTTELINLVAQTWAAREPDAGDLIILTEMEHHSNLVPWQMLAAGRQSWSSFRSRTTACSTWRPIGPCWINRPSWWLSRRCRMCWDHHAGRRDHPPGARGRRPHADRRRAVSAASGVDVQALDVDFLAFSAHKMCGPTGIGVLYGKGKLLEAMPPFLGGGDMIKEVKLRSFRPNPFHTSSRPARRRLPRRWASVRRCDYLRGDWHGADLKPRAPDRRVRPGAAWRRCRA